MENFRRPLAVLGLLALLAGGGGPAHAQSGNPNGDLDSFYRPVGSGDVIAKLPPRFDSGNSRFGFDERSFLTGSGGCPQEISIASIDEEQVFGNVNIEVVIEKDIFIQCSR